jgi:hypothetical protein
MCELDSAANLLPLLWTVCSMCLEHMQSARTNDVTLILRYWMFITAFLLLAIDTHTQLQHWYMRRMEVTARGYGGYTSRWAVVMVSLHAACAKW